MTPINFKGSNGTLTGGPAVAYGTDDAVGDLHIRRDGYTISSRWRPTLRERLMLLFCGTVELTVLSRDTHPPVKLDAVKEAK